MNGDACPFAHRASELRLHPQAADSGAVSLLTPLLGLASPGLEDVHSTSELSSDQRSGLSESHSDIWKDAEKTSAPVRSSAGHSAPPVIFDRDAPAKLPDVNGLGLQCRIPISIGDDSSFNQRQLDPHFPYGASNIGPTMATAAPLHFKIDFNRAPISALPQDMLPMKVAFPPIAAPQQDMLPMKVPFPQNAPSAHPTSVDMFQMLLLDRLLSVH